MSKSGLFAHFRSKEALQVEALRRAGGLMVDAVVRPALIAVQEGNFRRDLDCEQFAHDCQGIGLGFVHASRLMRDPKARSRADAAFEALVRAARTPSHAAAASG